MQHHEGFPKTELEFHDRFATEESCLAHLFTVRWPNGFVCPKCGGTAAWQSKKRPERWICKNRECGRQTSIRVGTILHKSRKPLREWMLSIFLMVTNKQSLSALRLQRLTGHGSYHTSVRWLRELRRAMGVALSQREPLGPIVEVDETFIGGKDEGGKRGVGSEKKAIVVGAVEAIGGRCGRARFQVIETQASDAIGDFVRRTVSKGSLIKSDWRDAYFAFADEYSLDARVVKETQPELEEYRRRKKRGEKDAQKKVAAHLPNFHRVVSLVKRIGISAHQGSIGRHLQLYLDEYCFRFDGHNWSQLFGLVADLTRATVKTQCVPYWRSCGRTAPNKSTYRQSKGFQIFAQAGSLG